MIDDLLDDPEVERLDPELVDFDFSGEAWVWADDQKWSWKNGPWKNERPPLTPALREKLCALCIAHLEGKRVWEKMVAHALRKMDWKDKYGWTAEDVASHAYEAVIPLGFDPESASWVKLTRRVMNRTIADLLKAQRAREEIVIPDYPHDRSEDSGHVSRVFSVDTVEKLRRVLTPRELEAVTYTYQDDFTNAMTAERMGISEQSVKDLLVRARATLKFNTF